MFLGGNNEEDSCIYIEWGRERRERERIDAWPTDWCITAKRDEDINGKTSISFAHCFFLTIIGFWYLFK